jgi:predicted dehydrogenase
VAEYPQGWLASAAGLDMWRLDPTVAGVSSAVGDIGVHAWHLARYVTGLEVEAICADLTTFGTGYELEDDANLLVHYQGGARGILYASQVSVGEENGLRLRVYGTTAGLDWRQENPNYLDLLHPGRPAEVYRRGNDYLDPVVRHNSRLPFGHPEAFIEAFANLYRNAARTIAARVAGEEPGEFDTDFPTVQDGARGVHLIHRAVESGKARGWVNATYTPPSA